MEQDRQSANVPHLGLRSSAMCLRSCLFYLRSSAVCPRSSCACVSPSRTRPSLTLGSSGLLSAAGFGASEFPYSLYACGFSISGAHVMKCWCGIPAVLYITSHVVTSFAVSVDGQVRTLYGLRVCRTHYFWVELIVAAAPCVPAYMWEERTWMKHNIIKQALCIVILLSSS